ncbi:ACP S-malonyltransferase [Geodermatophilus sp. SYSU D00758]
MTAAGAGPALVFPGQAAARAGMVLPWLDDAAAREVFDEASDLVGRDVADWWLDPAPGADPVRAHLAVVVTGVAAARSLVTRGLVPAAVAGYGVGAYTALVAAGALRLAEVLPAVHWRAELVALTPRPSCAARAAVVGPGATDVAAAAVAAAGPGGRLVVSALDGPERVVLAGFREELDGACAEVRAAGLEWVPVPMTGVAHSPLVTVAAARLDPVLAGLTWSVPSVPVVPDTDPVPTRDTARLATALRGHLVAPVRWSEVVEVLAGTADALVEIGSVPTLGPLARQVCPDLPVHLATGPDTPLPLPAPAFALAGPTPARGER